jgi:Flp pilus assembly protein TadD
LYGWILRIRNEISAAESAIETALKIEPKNIIALLNFGILSYNKGDFESAQDAFAKVVALDQAGSFAETASGYLGLLSPVP